jgi:RNase P/RNase MRP subunit p29
MMCGRDENPNQVQQLAEESLWRAHVVGLWTRVIDSKKQALKGLKETVDGA